MTTTIQVDLCRSSLTYCLFCTQRIDRDSLRIQIKEWRKPTVCYHLHCYQPDIQRPILLERDVALFNVQAEGDLRIVREWTERWNKRFAVRRNISPQFLKKSVSTNRPSVYRPLFEVFQYLCPFDIETRAALICKSWFHITRDEDFWSCKFALDFPPQSYEGLLSFRGRYIFMSQCACWHCDKYTPLREINLMCPLRKRPLCVKCAARSECELTSLDWFALRKYMGRDISTKLGVKSFTHDKVEKSYVADICEKVVPYAERRRSVLLSHLRESPQACETLLHFVASFDFSRYYSSRQQFVRRETVALATFCGKSDDGENVRKSVIDFLRMVQI